MLAAASSVAVAEAHSTTRAEPSAAVAKATANTAGLSPLIDAHLNVHGRYAFTPLVGHDLRPLRTPPNRRTPTDQCGGAPSRLQVVAGTCRPTWAAAHRAQRLQMNTLGLLPSFVTALRGKGCESRGRR